MEGVRRWKVEGGGSYGWTELTSVITEGQRLMPQNNRLTDVYFRRAWAATGPLCLMLSGAHSVNTTHSVNSALIQWTLLTLSETHVMSSWRHSEGRWPTVAYPQKSQNTHTELPVEKSVRTLNIQNTDTSLKTLDFLLNFITFFFLYENLL